MLLFEYKPPWFVSVAASLISLSLSLLRWWVIRSKPWLLNTMEFHRETGCDPHFSQFYQENLACIAKTNALNRSKVHLENIYRSKFHCNLNPKWQTIMQSNYNQNVTSWCFHMPESIRGVYPPLVLTAESFSLNYPETLCQCTFNRW